ncbi:MFS transporter [Saccharopolyspora pogona]|uniref:MFS transporter n=1 Tax=Saccharopolyspora pogona TaxID=333966 RepID=UPI001CC2362C|nr:MFS transporter [Saccharopolyspora pogona]
MHLWESFVHCAQSVDAEAGNPLAATDTGYGPMLVARIVTGVASQAFFGIAISLCAQLTRPEMRGRAIAVTMNGLMLGMLLGMLPSTLVGERFGWHGILGHRGAYRDGGAVHRARRAAAGARRRRR